MKTEEQFIRVHWLLILKLAKKKMQSHAVIAMKIKINIQLSFMYNDFNLIIFFKKAIIIQKSYKKI